VFKYAFKFNLATEKGKPVWKCPFYQFNAKGYGNVGIVVFDQGKNHLRNTVLGGAVIGNPPGARIQPFWSTSSR
jgi:hypothetical protein